MSECMNYWMMGLNKVFISLGRLKMDGIILLNNLAAVWMGLDFVLGGE